LLLASRLWFGNSWRTQTCWGGGWEWSGHFLWLETLRNGYTGLMVGTEPKAGQNHKKNEPVVDIGLSRFWTIFGSEKKRQAGGRP
jgi:hypothetical protein